jgi:hypothetical protein
MISDICHEERRKYRRQEEGPREYIHGAFSLGDFHWQSCRRRFRLVAFLRYPYHPEKDAFVAQSYLSILLLAVVALQVVISIRQWHAMAAQSKVMNETLIENKKAVGVSRASVDAMINKERARIRIEVYEPDEHTTYSHGVPLQMYFVPCKIFNHGPNPGRIKRTYAVVQVTGNLEKPVAVSNSVRMPIPMDGFFKPDAVGIERKIRSGAPFNWEAINEGKEVIHFYGLIEYSDLLTEEIRETAFQLAWYVVPGSERITGENRPRGWWMNPGDKNDNRET